MQTKVFRVLMAATLFGVSWLAVLGFGPDVLAAVGTDNAAGGISANRPAAAGEVVQIQTAEDALHLSSWEYTFFHFHFPPPPPPPPPPSTKQDVLGALAGADLADLQAAAAVLGKTGGSVLVAPELILAADLLALAAINTKSSALTADAEAMLAIAIQAGIDQANGNFVALLKDTEKAQQIANKAVLDASAYK